MNAPLRRIMSLTAPARTALAVPVLALCTLALPAAAEDADPASAEVLAVIDSWARGWAEQDAAVAVEDYSDDTDWTNAFGDRFQGKEELREGLEFIFNLPFVMAGDSAGHEYDDVTFLTPEVALIRSKLVRTGQLTSTGEAMPDRHIHHLRVVEKRDGRWQIVSHLISQAKEKR